MDLIIHDSKLKKVAYIDNELQDTLSFFDDKWSRYLDTASSTFEFTVYKSGIKSDTVKQKAYQTLTERSFLSFKFNKRTYLFNVMRTEETETTIRCYCENLNLELLNEMAGPFKATTEMSFVDYCNKFFLLVGGAITIGHNEIEDRERTLEWTGTDTKLKRLLSIANQFDAEIEFVTELNEDSSLKSFVLNIYKENDDKNQGVGRKRDDVILRYGHNIEGVKRTIDKTGIFNMITPIGKTTVDVTTTKANPKYVAPQLGSVTYSGGSLSNAGRTINKDLVNEILNLCVQHKLLPSGVFSQLYLESWWGNSPVARADNNWGGLTWTGSGNRPSGVVVTQGTARPANEGGYYMHFASVSDYMKDYTYLLAEQGIYKVKGANSIDSYTKGLFRVGGATYDYAAAGYDHYAPLMRSIRSGINSNSNGAMDTLDNQFKTAGTVGIAPVSQKADKVISTLNALTAKKGQLIGSGQCYAVSAWYAMTLGGPWLGGGVTNGFKGLYPGGGSAAARIGEDYNWSQFGWKMVRPSQVSHLIPGSIANIKANFNGGFLNTTGWGHTVVIKAISGDTLTVLEQNFAGHQYVEERTYSASAYLGAIQTLCYPPEIVQGKRIDGTESAPAQSGNNEPATISETQQKEVITRIPNDLYREWKNEDGVVEFYVKNGSLYAPISKELYPSAFTGDEVNDNWIKKSIEYNTIDIEKLISYSIEEIKKNCYPSISYEVKGTDESLDMGDTVKIDDEEFPDGLVLSARVSEQHISFTNPNSNQTVFDNYKALKNKLSKDLIDRYEELAEQAKPYELRLLTDKGTQFKNSTGLSVLTAELWKSNRQYDATFNFRNIDTLLASGLTYTVDGSTIPIDKPFLVSVDAFIGNELVATRQITFTNITDGQDGVGVNSTTVTYGISTSASIQPTSWTEALPAATPEQYLWTRKITDYTDPNKPDTIELTYSYQGKNGSAGTSVSVTKIEYQSGTSGTTAPSGTWITTIPSVPEGQFLWSKTTLSDGKIIYGIAKQGATGPQGPIGPSGKDGQNGQIPHIAYADKSTDVLVDAMPTFAVPSAYGGAVLTSTKIPGGYKMTSTGGTAQMKQVIAFNGTTGKNCYTYLKIKNTHPTNDILLSFNGIGATLNANFTSVIVKAGQTYVDFRQAVCRDTYNFCQINIGAYVASNDITYEVYEYSLFNTIPFINFSIETNTNASYIGMYQDTNLVGSTDQTKYNWSLMRGLDGKDGVPGTPGADGKTPYWHTAWANSADGKTDFSLTDSKGKQFRGEYIDYIQADSTDPTKYNWIDRTGNVKAGGINYIVKSNKQFTDKGLAATGITSTAIDGVLHVESFVGNGNYLRFDWLGRYPEYLTNAENKFNENDDFTITFWCKRLSGDGIPNVFIKSGMGYYPLNGELNSTEFKPISYTGKWKKANDIYLHLGFYNAIGVFEFEKFKLEKGNIATDYSEAPEDVQAVIDANQALTQAQMLALEERSALARDNAIAEAMKNTISEVEAKWQTWYNLNTADEKQKVANDIASLFERVAEFKEDLGEASAKFSFINNETLIGEEGVAIGDKEGKAKLFLSNDSISFVTNGVAQMTLTGDTLTIKNGLFTERIQIGNYVEEVYDRNPLYNVIRPIKYS